MLVIHPGTPVVVGHDAPRILPMLVIEASLLRVRCVRAGPALVAALHVIEPRLLAGKGQGGEEGHEKKGEGGLCFHAPVYHVPAHYHRIAGACRVLIVERQAKDNVPGHH